MNKNMAQYENLKNQVMTFRELATVAIRSGCYGNMTIETAMNVMLTAADMGVSPMKALNGGFHVIKGKIMIAGHLISDRIRRDGHSLKITEHTMEKCTIIGTRKENGDSYKCEYTVEEAQIAGLLASTTWQKYRKDMLYNRCMGRLGRVLFSDIVGSCYTEDEGLDILKVPQEKRPEIDPDAMWINNQPLAKKPMMEEFLEAFVSEENSADSLREYLTILSTRSNQMPEQIIEYALNPKYRSRFLDAYKKEMTQKTEEDSVEEKAV